MLTIFSNTEMHISLKAEKVFSIGSVNVTNSMLYGFVCALLLGWIMIVSAKRIHIRPQKGTFIGIIPSLKNIGKNHLMGSLMLPIILFFIL